MINSYFSVIFTTVVLFVSNHYLYHFKICQNLHFAAIFDFKQFTNIINYCHNYGNIIKVTKVRSRALDPKWYRKLKISMSAIFDYN